MNHFNVIKTGNMMFLLILLCQKLHLYNKLLSFHHLHQHSLEVFSVKCFSVCVSGIWAPLNAASSVWTRSQTSGFIFRLWLTACSASSPPAAPTPTPTTWSSTSALQQGSRNPSSLRNCAVCFTSWHNFMKFYYIWVEMQYYTQLCFFKLFCQQLIFKGLCEALECTPSLLLFL